MFTEFFCLVGKHHPLSTNQVLIDRAKVQDPVFKEQCDTATLNAIHHIQEENMRTRRAEPQHLPPKDRKFPCCKLILQHAPTHAIRTKTGRKLWHQRLCRFSLSVTAQACKHRNGVPEFKDDTLCPMLGQSTACIQAKLEKVSPGNAGFNPDTVQLPHQCLSINFGFAGLLSKDKTTGC